MNPFIACCLLCLPLKNLDITSPYGYRVHPVTGAFAVHRGVDLRAKADTVYAILDGPIGSVGFDERLGINIRITHAEVQSIYGHLSRVFVTPGQEVHAGDPIGITGATGRVTGEHLHFEITYHQRSIDPLEFILYYLLINNNEQRF